MLQKSGKLEMESEEFDDEVDDNGLPSRIEYEDDNNVRFPEDDNGITNSENQQNSGGTGEAGDDERQAQAEPNGNQAEPKCQTSLEQYPSGNAQEDRDETCVETSDTGHGIEGEEHLVAESHQRETSGEKSDTGCGNEKEDQTVEKQKVEASDEISDPGRRQEEKQNNDTSNGKNNGRSNDSNATPDSIQLHCFTSQNLFEDGAVDIIRRDSAGSSDQVKDVTRRQEFGSHIANTPAILLLNYKLLFIRSLFLIPILGVNGLLTVRPKDAVGLIGSIIRLQCSTNDQMPVYWEWIRFGSNQQQTIYYGRNGMAMIGGGRFSIDSDPGSGRYDLVINHLLPEDAGKYICVDEAGLGGRSEAELVVMDSLACEMPMLQKGFMGENIFDIPEDQVQASCSLAFTGNIVPRLRWSLDDGTPATGSQTLNGSVVSSVVRLRGLKEMDGAKLSCLSTVTYDSFTKEDILLWTSEAVSFRYVRLMFGSVDECQGSAMIPSCKPTCDYQLEKTVDSQCRCVAVYHNSGRKHNVTFNEYSCGVPPLSQDTLVAVVCSLIALIVVVTAFAIAFIAWKKLNSKKANANIQSSSTEPLMNGNNGVKEKNHPQPPEK